MCVDTTLLLSNVCMQAFLDTQPFLRLRLHEQKAVEDPFLPDVTPDGIPIEEATSTDLRRGE
jgi:collagen type II alpha